MTVSPWNARERKGNVLLEDHTPFVLLEVRMFANWIVFSKRKSIFPWTMQRIHRSKNEDPDDDEEHER